MQKRTYYWQSIFWATVICLVSACNLLPETKDATDHWSIEKLYTQSKNEMAIGAYDKAIGYLEKLEARYPFGTYAQQARIDIAYAYYRQNIQDKALIAIDNFFKLYPTHSSADYMLYLRGLVNFNDRTSIFNRLSHEDPSERDPQATRDAFNDFKQLVERYPHSKYTADAVARMQYLLHAIAKYDVHVAQYYLRRGAYLAAANRAQRIIKEYPETPSTENALSIMVQAYDRLKLNDLRDDTARVLKKNYPNSMYYKSGPVRTWP